MKSTYFFFLFLIATGSSVLIAQESVTKDTFLNTINGVNDLGMSNLKASELKEYNQGYTDKVYDVLESDKNEEEKTKALKTLNNDKNKDLQDLLGADDFKKYKKKMKKEMKPLTRKTKLLKFLI